MFDLGFWEMGVIGVIALIVLGPERLPKAAAKLGYWMGRFRSQALGVQAQLKQELGTDELRQALYQQEQELHNMKVLMEEARSKMEQEGKTLTSDDAEVNMTPLTKGDEHFSKSHDDPSAK